MIKKIFILLLFLNMYLLHAAHIPDHIVELVKEIPKEAEISHKKLSEYISSHCANDEETVLAFSYWIAKNIRYSLREAKEIHRTDKTAYEVLRNKKAVCEGYAILFQQLCEDAGITAFVVYGHGYGNVIKRMFNRAHMRHAWNAVYCNGKWQILDVTWAANEMKHGDFNQTGNLNWIFCEPEDFSISHYPNDPRWQMLQNPLSAREFWGQSKHICIKNYAIADSLNILLQRQRYINEMIICKSEFIEQQQQHKYLNNLIDLGWKYINGPFDETRINNGLQIFNFAQSELENIDPLLEDVIYSRMIETGKQTANYRMAQGE
ncbi:MAG: hypothetical protein IPM74_12905 [Crocinitomicaceae bacterium]|nr:hypothetical protein [Crocinitomicaceae bacterium]MBK8926773.1 hypothetical protein [Crocinitomicaceae bacterium]